MLFLGLLDISLNRLAAILHLHLPGGVQGWVYGAESVFIIFNSFFLSKQKDLLFPFLLYTQRHVGEQGNRVQF